MLHLTIKLHSNYPNTSACPRIARTGGKGGEFMNTTLRLVIVATQLGALFFLFSTPLGKTIGWALFAILFVLFVRTELLERKRAIENLTQ